MADLLIKPEAGSGNKLILQDQAGNAVLTTADSGASISENSLPAGTMIWIGEKRVTSTAASISSATSWTKTGNGTASLDLDLTIPAATVAKFSKIYVQASHMILVATGSSFTLAETKFRRENSNGDSDLGFRHIFGIASTAHSVQHSMNRYEVDTSLPATGDVTYSVQVRKHHGNAGYAGSIAPLGAETDTTAIISAYGII